VTSTTLPEKSTVWGFGGLRGFSFWSVHRFAPRHGSIRAGFWVFTA
jgi:hypothetical protein